MYLVCFYRCLTFNIFNIIIEIVCVCVCVRACVRVCVCKNVISHKLKLGNLCIQMYIHLLKISAGLVFNVNPLKQWSSNLAREIHFHAEFSSNPNQTHLTMLINVFRGLFHKTSLPNKPGLFKQFWLIFTWFGLWKQNYHKSSSDTEATYAEKLTWSGAG